MRAQLCTRRLSRRAVYLAGALAIAAILAVLAFAANRQSTHNAAQDQANANAAATNAAESASNAALAQTREAEEALHQALQTSRLQLAWNAHVDGTSEIAHSPDGASLATLGANGVARIWDAQSGTPISELQSLPCPSQHTIGPLTR